MGPSDADKAAVRGLLGHIQREQAQKEKAPTSLAPGYRIEMRGQDGTIPVVIDPDGQMVAEVDALDPAQADAERRLSRARPGTRPDLIDSVNRYRRARGEPLIDMPRGAETGSIAKPETSPAAKGGLAAVSDFPQHRIPTDPATPTAAPPVPYREPAATDYLAGIGNAAALGAPEFVSNVLAPDPLDRATIFDRGRQATGRFGRTVQAMPEAFAGKLSSAQLDHAAAGITNKIRDAGRAVGGFVETIPGFRGSAQTSRELPVARPTTPEPPLPAPPTAAAEPVSSPPPIPPPQAGNQGRPVPTAPQPEATTPRMEAPLSPPANAPMPPPAASSLLPEASSPPGMEYADFLDSLQRGVRGKQPDAALMPAPRQITPPSVDEVPLPHGREGGAARRGAIAARTRSADDLQRILQDDILAGGHSGQNNEAVVEALRVLDSRTKADKPARDAILDALRTSYPEARKANLRRALERTKPYLDDAGGDVDKARDMVARRRQTGVKTYAIPATIGLGAASDEDMDPTTARIVQMLSR